MVKKIIILFSLAAAIGAVFAAVSLSPNHEQESPSVTVNNEDSPTHGNTSSSKQPNTRNRSDTEVSKTKNTNKKLAVKPEWGHAEPYPNDTQDEKKIITEDGQSYPLRVYEALVAPNDPQAVQWWVSDTGLDTAWQQPAGSYTPIIAVIDTGFALQHEEFLNRWHTNIGEAGPASQEADSDLNCTNQGIPLDMSCNNIDDDYDGNVDNEAGVTTVENPSNLNCTDQSRGLDKSCNNIDDDGNGLIDDFRGWDFSNFDASVQTGETDPAGSGTTHGSMVAGVLAATGNNGVGIAGVNWTAKILPIQALDDSSYGDTLTVARSVYYAADQGADIISISLGSSGEDPYLRQAIDYALDHGSLVVAASGNDGCQCITYPANYPEVLAVGASTPLGEPATFSNYGTQLDLLAPGENITTPTWNSAYQTNAYASGVAGTSFSTPYVSGLLSLAKSHQPNATWGELVAALLENTDHDFLTVSNPHSSTIGFGYARADSLLSRVTTPQQPLMRYRFGPVMSSDTLDTIRNYQCFDEGFPTTPLYELTHLEQVRYTVSELSLHRAQQDGWSGRRLAYVCVGLPGDTPNTLRIINMLTEFHAS